MNTAAQHRQYKHHQPACGCRRPLGQNGEDGGRAHHARIGSDEQHGKEAAREQPVLPPVFAAQRRVDFGKGFHRDHVPYTTPLTFRGWRPAVRPETHRAPCRARASTRHTTPSRRMTTRSQNRGCERVVRDHEDGRAECLPRLRKAVDDRAGGLGVRLPVGSSAKMSSGWLMSARATAVRCFRRPEISAGYLF